MILEASTGLPGFGIFPANMKRRVINRTGATLSTGMIAMLDVAQSATEVTTVTLGDDNGIWSNVVLPTAAAIDCDIPAFFCIALSDIADNASGICMFHGICDALCESATGGAGTVGARLSPTTAGVLDATSASAASERIVAMLMEAFTARTAAEALSKVYFNGLVPLGIYATA